MTPSPTYPSTVCDGCSGHGPTRLYTVWSIDGDIFPARYCDGCAELAAMNWNGETADLVVNPHADTVPGRHRATSCPLCGRLAYLGLRTRTLYTHNNNIGATCPASTRPLHRAMETAR